ncbi:hypothetical protein BOTBODRAFT_43867 [Botryobasidium botryosum FD-172 SS1]|uniref:Uncharacterized protein n=1 Tax=Botryobasidium botryosum (strain FD-172 SS1) TaxID=930990 RepID=A0A067MJM9_BOTB1|nr:hypothetical protein BOTBODRAFT_43867 [Botryobasidium botryosum FD-172 SS1]
MHPAQNYVCRRILRSRHANSINSLAFSRDGAYLASGGQDGKLSVWCGDDGEYVCGISYDKPLQALLWHPRVDFVLISGYADGSVVWSRFSPIQGDPRLFRKLIAFDTPVDALAFDSKNDRLAVGSGAVIKIYKRQLVTGIYKQAAVYKHQGDVNLHSLAFIEDGARLIGSFVQNLFVCWDPSSMDTLWSRATATKIGSSDVSPDASHIVSSNLRDGFELYGLASSLAASSSSLKAPTQVGMPLPALFVHDGGAVLGGSSSGNFPLWDLESSSVLQALPHDYAGTTQALAAYSHRELNVWRIATATSDSGLRNSIRIWQAGTPSPVAPSPQSLRLRRARERSYFQILRDGGSPALAELIVAAIVLLGLYNFCFPRGLFNNPGSQPPVITYAGAPATTCYNPSVPPTFQCTTSECSDLRSHAYQSHHLPRSLDGADAQKVKIGLARYLHTIGEGLKFALRRALFYFYASITSLQYLLFRVWELMGYLFLRVYTMEEEVRAWVHLAD